MLDLLLANRIHFAYHAYHESSFGLFDGEGSLRDENHANAALLQLFRTRLAPPRRHPRRRRADARRGGSSGGALRGYAARGLDSARHVSWVRRCSGRR
jgi:hypothetical protein